MSDWREMFIDDPMTLYHHGILGQKWGVRRYQNKDGSLTDAGRKRYEDNHHIKDAEREATKLYKYDVEEMSEAEAKTLGDTKENFKSMLNSKEMVDMKKAAEQDPCGRYGRSYQNYIKQCEQKYEEAYDKACEANSSKEQSRPYNPFSYLIVDDATVESYESYTKHIKDATIDQVDKKWLFGDLFSPSIDNQQKDFGYTDDEWDEFKFECLKDDMRYNAESYSDVDWKKYRK